MSLDINGAIGVPRRAHDFESHIVILALKCQKVLLFEEAPALCFSVIDLTLTYCDVVVLTFFQLL